MTAGVSALSLEAVTLLLEAGSIVVTKTEAVYKPSGRFWTNLVGNWTKRIHKDSTGYLFVGNPLVLK